MYCQALDCRVAVAPRNDSFSRETEVSTYVLTQPLTSEISILLLPSPSPLEIGLDGLFQESSSVPAKTPFDLIFTPAGRKFF